MNSLLLGIVLIGAGIYGLLFYLGKIRSSSWIYLMISKGKMTELEKGVLLVLSIGGFCLGLWFLTH